MLDLTKEEAVALLCMADNEVSRYYREYLKFGHQVYCKDCVNHGDDYGECAKIAVPALAKLKAFIDGEAK